MMAGGGSMLVVLSVCLSLLLQAAKPIYKRKARIINFRFMQAKVRAGFSTNG
jgi:hypothetical protein